MGIGICGLQVTKSVSSSDEMGITSALREDEDEEGRDENSGEPVYVLLEIDNEVNTGEGVMSFAARFSESVFRTWDRSPVRLSRI